MNYEDFKENFQNDVKEAIEDRIGKEVTVGFHDVEKVNINYEAITITPVDSNVGVNLNLTAIYEAVQEGENFGDAVEKAARTAERGIKDAPVVDAQSFSDYEQMKDKLIMQVVSTERNAELLDKVPHTEVEDMSVVYRFQVESGEAGIGTILVTNEMLKNYDITEDQLKADALENAPELKPAVIKGMTETMMELMGEEFPEQFPVEMLPEDEKMYVATVPDKMQGASVIAYQDFMDQAAEKVGGDFYLLPSSVHEVLLVKDDGEFDAKSLQAMVVEVNATQVPPEDLLTDNVYHYDSKERVFELADKFEARKQEREKRGPEVEEKSSVLGDLEANQKKIKAQESSKDVTDKTPKKDKGDVSL